jgi:hypothetical protein
VVVTITPNEKGFVQVWHWNSVSPQPLLILKTEVKVKN